MKSLLCMLFILGVTAISSRAHDSEKTYNFKASFLPAGLTFFSGFRGSDNLLTDSYLNTATTGRANTFSLELSYKTKKSFVLFGRYENLTMISAQSDYEQRKLLEGQYEKYLLSNGKEKLIARVEGGNSNLHGFSFGIGYPLKIKAVSLEPYFAARGIFWMPYHIHATFKKIENNHYFKEEFSGKTFFAFAPVTGMKFNVDIKNRFGITVESLYALLPLKISYDYSLQDSEGPRQQRQIEEKFLLSVFQINLGTYFKF
jgi:hypothetical protein